MSEREALVKGLGKAHIEMIRRQWDQDLYPCNAEFYALCNMALAAISTPQPADGVVPSPSEEETIRSILTCVHYDSRDAVESDLRNLLAAAKEQKS